MSQLAKLANRKGRRATVLVDAGIGGVGGGVGLGGGVGATDMAGPAEDSSSSEPAELGQGAQHFRR